MASKFTNVAINVLAPIGTFIAGYTAKDPVGLEGVIKPYLPRVLQGTLAPVTGYASGLITSLVYGALFGLVIYIGSSIGGLMGGVVRAASFFFLGCAVRLALAGLQGGVLSPVLPSNA